MFSNEQLSQIQAQLAFLVSQCGSCSETLSEWCAVWLETYKKPVLRLHSLLSIQACLDKYILPSLGHYPLAELDGVTVQKTLNSICFPRQREISYMVLHGCLKKAVQLGKIVRNPVDAVERPRPQTKRGKALTQEEQKRFETVIHGTKFETVFTGYLLTGCRLRELLAVRWCDVDFQSSIIRIYGTKTHNAIREVPLFPRFRNLLVKTKRTGEKVFTFKPDYIDRYFQKLCEKAGLSGFVVHSLRHTFATRCMESGVHVKVLQEWLGHADISMTLGTYSHVYPDFAVKESQKLISTFS